ncbi:MAG TPA: LysR family transcriptional regulator [Gaiellaceae bacterium]|nr:LysR family transcriptional regulator [Gaiellaceae bacterium]
MEPDRWLGVELRHLTALRAIADEGSFGRAATRLGYTQSAVSQQIATLERAVGERLLERPGGPRPVSLTEAGAVLLRHAQAIVARLDAARADLEALSAGEAGTLRVGAYQSIGQRILPAIIRSFAGDWPAVDLRITEASMDQELFEAIEGGDLDLTFADFSLWEGPFEAADLLRDPYVLLVQADSPLAKQGRAPTLSEIAELPLIGFRQCRSVAALEAHFHDRGLRPEFVFRSDDNGIVQAMVSAGLGVAIAPRLAVDFNDPSCVALPLGDMVPPRRLVLLWHRDRYRSPASLGFTEVAVDVCRAFADDARTAA